MSSHFKPDDRNPATDEAGLVDPEAYDASEQQFAASLDMPTSGHNQPGRDSDAGPGAPTRKAEIVSAFVGPAGIPDPPGPEAWRQQVAEKLNKYRARRQPREPRYPSLQLKFEPSDPSWEVVPPPPEPGSHLILDGSAAADHVAHDGWPADVSPLEGPSFTPPAETSARVIPFRRSANAPPKPLEELAEPLQLFPRILEAPEVAPPPPALGGILIEPQEEQANPKQPGIDLPLQISPLARRALAAGADGFIIAAGLALFAYIFFRITGADPPLKQLLAMGAAVGGILWAGYQYLLLTHAGSTPGLMLAGLRLSQFDGCDVAKNTRRWRALASILSAVSLGLGYAWSILDEDQLCWHDRITKTHLAPKR